MRDTPLPALVVVPRRLPQRRAWSRVQRFARRSPLGAISAVMLALMILVAVLAPRIAPFGYSQVDLDARLVGPGAKHMLGTDGLGRDVLSRLIYGARVSLGIGFLAVTISVTAGTVIGIISGYLGGVVDLLVQRVVDVVISFPPLIIALSVLAVFGGGISSLAFVLGGIQTTGVTRIVRSQSLTLRGSPYILAARATGATSWRIIFRQILPNVVPISIVMASILLGGVILAEASLSFLGFGVQPPYPSWGAMLNTSARTQMLRAPFLSVWPGLAITVVVFSFNMFGDALRDTLDPRLRGSGPRL